MPRELRLCPGVGSHKCGAFLSSLDRDPHPTCTRCRGRVCTRDLTCDICAEWSSAQWEAFAKKRSYAERKSSRPSGSLPLVPKTSPRAGISSEVTHPAASFSSSSLPSGGGVGGGGVVLGMHLVPLPLLPLDLGPARGVEVPLDARLVLASALLSPSGVEEPGAARSQQTPVARSAPSLVASPHSSLHALRGGGSRESSEVRSRSRSSRASQSSARETRKDCRVRSQSGSSCGQSRRFRFPLAVKWLRASSV